MLLRNVLSLTLFLMEAADMLQNLSLDSQPKPLELPEPTKKVISTCRWNLLIFYGNIKQFVWVVRDVP